MSIVFQPFQISDKSLFERHLRQSGRIGEHAFANLFCWQHAYGSQWAECEDRLIVRTRAEGMDSCSKYIILPDIRTPHLSHILKMIEEDAEQSPYVIAQMSPEEAEELQQMFQDHFLWNVPRSSMDYIYPVEQFKTFKGRKLAAKRNHVNKFKSLYDYHYETLDTSHFEECLRLEQQWRSGQSDPTGQLLAEEQVIRTAFEHYHELDCIGGALFVGDTLVAFTYGTPLNHDIFDIHIEKGDTCFEGVFPMISQQFALHLPEQYRLLNREEDLGLPGLRKSKLSYNPCRLEQKWCARPMSADLKDIVDLWQTCFHDERAFVDAFLSRFYKPQHAITRKAEGHIVSLCLLVPCASLVGRIGYLYGISTREEFRCKGLAEQTIREAIDYCRKQGMAAVALIPESDELSAYYTRFGFSSQRIPVTFTNDIDLGTGQPEYDKAMLLWLNGSQDIETLVLTAEEI